MITTKCLKIEIIIIRHKKRLAKFALISGIMVYILLLLKITFGNSRILIYIELYKNV